MDFIINNAAHKQAIFAGIKQAAAASKTATVKYIDLSGQWVKVVSYTPEVSEQLQQQIYHWQDTLPPAVKAADATIIVWPEDDFRHVLAEVDARFDPRRNLRLRIDELLTHNFCIRVGHSAKLSSVYLDLNAKAEYFKAYDEKERTCYLALRNFAPEEFIKHGHIFVQQLYKLCATPKRHLVHGAAVGIDGTGVLLCARGQRGKSTLAVHALLAGFDYVSDDYLLLDEETGGLYASPIYNIITLSPQMHAAMGSDFRGRFISLNARKDKGVYNMAAYQRQFKTHYPIKLCMFPQICADAEPSIVPCAKGQAVVQMIHSTLLQTGDLYNTAHVQKLLRFLTPFAFYQINLCRDIAKNTQCLRQFLTTYQGK